MAGIAFVFPGQGSQVVGMGRDLHHAFPAVRTLYDKAGRVLGLDLARISFEGPEDELKQTRVTQPAIFVHSLAVVEVLREKFGRDRVRCAMTAGHSLGEYSALVTAGVLTFEDALKVVKVRAEAMQEAGEQNRGTMAAVIGMDADALGAICCEAYPTGVVQCANFNSPGQIVISGSVEGVHKAMAMARDRGARMVKELVVSGAFHSPLMEPAREQVRRVLETVRAADAAVDVYPNVTAQATRSKDALLRQLVDQITGAVKWHETIAAMVAGGATSFYELGPGSVLQGLIKRIDKNVRCECIGKTEDVTKFESDHAGG